METPKSKPCKACGQTKPLAEFYRNAAMRDGHFGKCIRCMRAEAKARYEANIDAERARARSRYHKIMGLARQAMKGGA
jgi:hypothetical protein